jgi:hypothetical protein
VYQLHRNGISYFVEEDAGVPALFLPGPSLVSSNLALHAIYMYLCHTSSHPDDLTGLHASESKDSVCLLLCYPSRKESHNSARPRIAIQSRKIKHLLSSLCCSADVFVHTATHTISTSTGDQEQQQQQQQQQ